MSSFREATELMIVRTPSGGYAQRIVDENVSLTTAIDAVDSTTTYVGKAAIGSATSGSLWSIKKITVSGTVTRITWADGNANFDNVWDNRASLSYT